MKSIFLGLCGSALLSLSVEASPSDLDRLKTLNFTDRNGQDIQEIVSHLNACSELLRAAIVTQAVRARKSTAEEVVGVRVVGGCQVVSLNHDGKLQVVATADLEDGNGPLSYIAVFKRSGQLKYANMAIGEGNGSLGPLSVSLKDIKNDGRLEVIVKERHVDERKRIGAHVDPAPFITNIYEWSQNSFVLANDMFRDYFTFTVMPDLQQQLMKAQSSVSVSLNKQKRVDALQSSIVLETRLLAEGHY